VRFIKLENKEIVLLTILKKKNSYNEHIRGAEILITDNEFANLYKNTKNCVFCTIIWRNLINIEIYYITVNKMWRYV